MSARILIVDYGMGNLYSVYRALEVCGGEGIVISDRADEVATAERVILPGVGAFADGMAGLRERGLIEPIVTHARAGKPLLGICLGMQMLATTSEEFGRHAGLDLIPGEVKPIPCRATDGRKLKVPVIGWTTVDVRNPMAAAGCLANHRSDAAVYLLHSFHVVPRERPHLLATYDFGGHHITAAIKRDNITGFQFHPEKSGAAGLGIIRTFIGEP